MHATIVHQDGDMQNYIQRVDTTGLWAFDSGLETFLIEIDITDFAHGNWHDVRLVQFVNTVFPHRRVRALV